MKHLTLFLISASLLWSFAALGQASRPDSLLLEPLRGPVDQIMKENSQINPERKALLKKAAEFISRKAEQGQPAHLTFICTHNSRRSHLAQIWAQTAAAYFGLANVTAFSGGTEATAFNPRTVAALRRNGFSIVRTSDGSNPVYLVQYSESQPPVKMYSKRYFDEGNPATNYAAMMCCDDADRSCPDVQGAALRLAITYQDPKKSDGTPAEAATYDQRSREIAREMFYLMSQAGPRQASSSR